MDKANKELISQMLYYKSKLEVLKLVERIESVEMLHVFAYNYDWDNGFEIPEKILNNKYCDLSTALTIFYLSDGLRYLNDKEYDPINSSEWYKFVKELYNKILEKQFNKSNIRFVPPLSRLQLYKLRKRLNKNEFCFIESLDGIDIDIKI